MTGAELRSIAQGLLVIVVVVLVVWVAACVYLWRVERRPRSRRRPAPWSEVHMAMDAVMRHPYWPPDPISPEDEAGLAELREIIPTARLTPGKVLRLSNGHRYLIVEAHDGTLVLERRR